MAFADMQKLDVRNARCAYDAYTQYICNERNYFGKKKFKLKAIYYSRFFIY